MSYSEDIKTIAETKELYDLANKALKAAQTPSKDDIKSKRSLARQETDGSKADSTGSNASGDTNTVTGADGNNSLYEFGAAPVKPLNVLAAIQELYDKYLEMRILFGIAFGPSTFGTYLNDLSASATPLNSTVSSILSGYGGGGTRTQAANQADPANATGTQATDWAAISAAMTLRGATADDIAAAKLLFFTTEAGRYEIGALVSGDAGPKPSVGNWDTITSNIQPKPRPEILNAIVGVDPDNPTMAMEVRFDNRDSIPSTGESDAAGQNYWTSVDTPPSITGWTLGYRWALSGAPGGTIYTYSADLAGEAGAAALNASPPIPGDVPYIYVNTTGTGLSAVANYTRTINPPFTLPNQQTSCSVGVDTYCPATAPGETYWPQVGLFILKWGTSGKFEFSAFDSEVPAKFAAGVSQIEIKSALTGLNYTIEPGIEGGFLISATSSPDYFLYYGSDRSLRAVVPVLAYKFYKAR